MPHTRNIKNAVSEIAPADLTANVVELWRLDLEAVRGEELRWRELLSADELARADRFHFARDRQNFIAARALLRRILGAYLTEPPATLRFSYSRKEKPGLAEPFASKQIEFNVSHSGNVALCAFAIGRAVGIDVEEIRQDMDPQAIARRYFSQHEQAELAHLPAAEQRNAFFRCWTRKESYIKATGDGLSLPLNQFDVSLKPGDDDALLATRGVPDEAQNWWLRDIDIGSGYAAAVCVRGRDWRLQDWL